MKVIYGSLMLQRCTAICFCSEHAEPVVLRMDDDSEMPYPAHTITKSEAEELIKFIQKELESME